MSSLLGSLSLENPSISSSRHTAGSKAAQSPFLARRNQQRVSSPQNHTPTRLPSDATSTSSSTLVNIDTNGDYYPWEVQSDSSHVSGDRFNTSMIAEDQVRSSPFSSRPANTRRRATPRSKLRKLCPDDCRCSDQELSGSLCRRAAGSSSSSDSSSLSVQVYDTRQTSAIDPAMTTADEPSLDRSFSSGRDLRKDPVLAQRDASRRSRPSTSTLYRSFDQLQKGLGVSVTPHEDSDADSDAEASRDRRTDLAARLASRRNERSTAESIPEARSPPKRRPWLSTPSNISSPQTTYQTPESQGSSHSPFKTPASGRRSIAAVFESMQKEREARAAEEQRRWQEKQEERERQRTARAVLAQSTCRSPSASPAANSASLKSSPVIASIASPSVRTTPSATPILSTPSSPAMDEPMAEDVLSRHLHDEAAPHIPETLSEGTEEEEDVANSNDLAQSPPPYANENELEGATAHAEPVTAEHGPTTPQPSQAFGFASQPMALDLSPTSSGAGTISNLSSPATSPRKASHRRQNTAVTSVTARLPPSSVKVAQSRLNQALHRSSDQPVDITPLKYAATNAAAAYPQTPGILSSTKKRLQGDMSTKSRHNVRFSPRPDYRSDSGSWDESEHQLELPERPEAPEIVIPEILADASTELDVTGNGAVQHVSPIRRIVEPETGNGSFSRSVHLPGAYLPSPAKLAAPASGTSPVSRHVIRPSPTSVRTKVLNFAAVKPQQPSGRNQANDSDLSHTSSAGSPESSPSRQRTAVVSRGASEFGLFPDANVPRTSTPPPPVIASGRSPARGQALGAYSRDDPRSSPRSPRPLSLKGSNKFAAFQASPSSSMDEGNDSVNQVVRTILSTLDTARKTRAQHLGAAVGRVNEQIESVLQLQRSLGPTEPLERTRTVLQEPDRVEVDDAAVGRLRDELTHALTTLAARVQTGTVRTRVHRPKWVLALVLGAQLGLMAFLLHVAERKAQRMRMYAGAEYAISYTELYRGPGAVEWTAAASESYLTPLLHLPILGQLAGHLPPLPSPAMLNVAPYNLSAPHAPATPTIWHLYRVYISLHGWRPFVLQLALYTLAQLTSLSLLLLLAPLQIIYYLLTF